MQGPWEKYAQQPAPEAGPWAKYAGNTPEVTVKLDYDPAPDLANQAAKYPTEAEKAALSATAEPRSIGGFVNNAISSGGKMAGGIVQAVTSPLQTAKAVGGLVAGAAERLIPGEQSHEKNVDALVQMFVDRYGGVENLKKTLYEDPSGALGDIATLAGGVGAAAKGVGLAAKLGQAGNLASKAGTVAKMAGTVADVADPLRLAGRVAAPIAEATGIPERLYQSALKPGAKIKNDAQLKNLITTGLENKIPVSPGGADRLHGLVKELNTKIADEIKTGTRQGVTIDPQNVAGRLKGVADKFKNQVNPNDDLKAISDSGKEFLQNNPGPIPAADAQAMKQGTYKQLSAAAYGSLKNATVESRKALARGIKEELATAFPELSKLNATESKLLNLEPELTKAVKRIGNHQIFGIGTPLAAAGAEAVTGNIKIAAAAAILRGIIDQPNIKSRLAINLFHASKRVPGMSHTTLATATSRVQDYINSLENFSSQNATPSVSLPQ